MRTALSISLLLVTGCTDKDVVALVGKHEVRLHDLAQHRQSTGAVGAKDADVLDQLVARERLAVDAERLGLAKSPETQARIRAATREILAQAAIAKATEGVDEAKALEWYKAHASELQRRTVDVAQIVFLAAPDAPLDVKEASRSRATAAYARLLGGEPFADVAKAVSEDAATAAKGGALGRIREGEVSPELFTQLVALKAGAYTPPLAGPAGFHLFSATAAGATEEPTFEAAKSRILERLRTEAERELVERVAKDVVVQRFPERLVEAKR